MRSRAKGVMMAAGSDITLVKTGMLPMLVAASAALTAPTALVLLELYRRSVVRAMAAAAPGAIPHAETAATPHGLAEPLRVTYVDIATPPEASGPPEVRLPELDTPSARAVGSLLALLLAERAAAAPVHASVAVPT
jgi:hypothetical protein